MKRLKNKYSKETLKEDQQEDQNIEITPYQIKIVNDIALTNSKTNQAETDNLSLEKTMQSKLKRPHPLPSKDEAIEDDANVFNMDMMDNLQTDSKRYDISDINETPNTKTASRKQGVPSKNQARRSLERSIDSPGLQNPSIQNEIDELETSPSQRKLSKVDDAHNLNKPQD